MSATTPLLDVEAAVILRADEQGMTLDEGQRRLLRDLAEFVADAGDGLAADAPVGIYLHGPAGRGKTWIMRAVHDAIPGAAEGRRRVHFHTFFDQLQKLFAAQLSARDAIEQTVAELLDGAEWFLFDELHVHDPAGATLLSRLLDEIAERRIPTLITSNYTPAGLLPGPYHAVMEPGIRTIRAHFDVREIDAGVDYREVAPRRRDGFSSGRWILSSGDGDDALRAAGLEPPRAEERTEIVSGHYRFDVTAVRDDELWVRADELLEQMTTPQDYLGWSADYRRWVLLDLPPMSRLSRAAQQRLVGLLDVLADQDVPLTVLSPVSREDLIDITRLPPDVFRARSRLSLLGGD